MAEGVVENYSRREDMGDRRGEKEVKRTHRIYDINGLPHCCELQFNNFRFTRLQVTRAA
jgi:hypothetical protein